MSFCAFQTAFANVTITGKDTPDDKGSSISLNWTFSDGEIQKKAINVHVFRREGEAGAFEEVKVIPASTTSFGDKRNLKNDTPYYYYLLFKDFNEKGVYKSDVFGPFDCRPQWFKSQKKVNLLFAVIAMTIILLFINLAKRGKKLYIRPLAGVKAIEDAVGRAAEMGKPCVYSPGISYIEDIATLASISILAKVSEVIAEYNSRLIVPNYDPIVYSVTDEVVKNAYIKSGRPDAYRPEDVYFLTQRQFAYASGISGLMAREKPAANFFLGWFMAESLILAEAGAMTGAVQIAGTDSISQIPFFIVACDYTLIGEELYAAGAYMAHDTKLLGGLKGQDYVKLVLMVTLVVLFFLKLFGVEGIDTILLGGR
jgi:hypothetical protein